VSKLYHKEDDKKEVPMMMEEQQKEVPMMMVK
jgi:hypothetical protein